MLTAAHRPARRPQVGDAESLETPEQVTEAEYQQLVKDAYRGGTLIGVDRGFARKLYTDVSTAKIRELTGETPYVEKAVVWFAFLGGPLFALTSFVLAGIVFRWWALAVIPVCFVVWFSYKGISSRGSARMFSISLALATAVGAYLANVIPNRVAALFAVSFLLALWCERLLYCAATFFLRALVVRNFKAFTNFRDGLTLADSSRGA